MTRITVFTDRNKTHNKFNTSIYVKNETSQFQASLCITQLRHTQNYCCLCLRWNANTGLIWFISSYNRSIYK